LYSICEKSFVYGGIRLSCTVQHGINGVDE
jgi:hypothetical protein